MKRFSTKQFKDWIVSEVRQSIIDDAETAIKAFSRSGTGFFAVPRLLFPEIDGLGSYLTGEADSTGKNIFTYLKRAMSLIDPRYAEYAAFITFIFRHGLLHQHSPKKFKYGEREFGWQFEINTTNTPENISRRNHLVFRNNLLLINMNLFYEDLVNSIDRFLAMVDTRQVSYKNINSAMQKQFGYLKRKDLSGRGKAFLNKDDLAFLKRI